ncbi:hypothetical protein Cri9333_3913 [Crinalium epipsammum PCC 9333]|uniref:Uncharacterized protein n=2 Tax=Crinalium TaxID=241421 RepID=K9W4Q4_9CYAN|nr:hypothetical protein Cri9333_3913 [Crinalium epipsammum PCC 9333]
MFIFLLPLKISKDVRNMTNYKFHDELSLAETAENLGKEAIKLGLIPSFVVRFFPDSRQFYIPDETKSEPLTPEEAYLQLKKLVEEAAK